ncbi:ribonuclease E inhibitor RraB [Pirellulimonas nuda]|uniref:ribonuclease E inhibitor RraB n=1 Tax=Pirellulimonas nuda TaxID=2528009 RepID=UPI003703B37E
MNATRQALRQIEQNGSDLSKPLLMDFFVAVPSHSAGVAVAKSAATLGFTACVEADETSGEWTCYCTITIIPELSTVTKLEKRLDMLGRSVGGTADGFGTFGNALKSDEKRRQGSVEHPCDKKGGKNECH